MQNLSYSLSSRLKESLQTIEMLRQKIALTPLSLKDELRIRWQAKANRIYYSLLLANNTIKKKDVAQLLSGHYQRKKKLNLQEQEVIRYKDVFDHIEREWLANPNQVTSKTAITIHNMIGKGDLDSTEIGLKRSFDYVQINPESTIIQAGLAQIHILALSPFKKNNEAVSRLIAYLFLYKGGYSMRNFLVIEKYWRKNLNDFKYNVDSVIKSKNATFWLEYFAEAISNSLEEVIENMASKQSQTPIPASFWELNDRQKEILILLEEPNVSITNRKVQKMFNISQITASRDLAKLASLGFLVPHGKGRSVYYARA